MIKSRRRFFIKEFWWILAALDRLFRVQSCNCDALLALYDTERKPSHHHLFELFVATHSPAQARVELVLSLLLYCSLFKDQVVEVPAWIHDVVSK